MMMMMIQVIIMMMMIEKTHKSQFYNLIERAASLLLSQNQPTITFSFFYKIHYLFLKMSSSLSFPTAPKGDAAFDFSGLAAATESISAKPALDDPEVWDHVFVVRLRWERKQGRGD